MTGFRDAQAFDRDFDDPLDADLDDDIPTHRFSLPAPVAAGVDGDLVPRPGTLKAENRDPRQQLLARLLQAHEVRLLQPAPGLARRAHHHEATGFSAPAPDEERELNAAGWQAPLADDELDLWEALDTPANRKAWRAMV